MCAAPVIGVLQVEKSRQRPARQVSTCSLVTHQLWAARLFDSHSGLNLSPQPGGQLCFWSTRPNTFLCMCLCNQSACAGPTSETAGTAAAAAAGSVEASGRGPVLQEQQRQRGGLQAAAVATRDLHPQQPPQPHSSSSSSSSSSGCLMSLRWVVCTGARCQALWSLGASLSCRALATSAKRCVCMAASSRLLQQECGRGARDPTCSGAHIYATMRSILVVACLSDVWFAELREC
jgi:hypothetical protein